MINNQQYQVINNSEEKSSLQKVRVFYMFLWVDDIILVIRQMQDIRMDEIGKGILRSLGQITRNRMISGEFSYFTEGGREKAQSRGQKYQRKQSCNAADLSKLLKNYSSSTQKSSKAKWEKENLYIYDIPVAPKYKRKASCKQSRNQIQKSFNYSQIKSCLDINDPIPTAISTKTKKGNSISSTCCSGKSGTKQGRNNTKSKALNELLDRSSILLEEYQSKCKDLQRENLQIKQKYYALSRKIKRLSKNREIDLINVF